MEQERSPVLDRQLSQEVWQRVAQSLPLLEPEPPQPTRPRPAMATVAAPKAPRN